MLFIHLFKPVEGTVLRVNPIVNSGLRVKIVSLCRFSNCNKCTTVVGEVDNGGGYVCVEGGREYMDISVPFSQFYCELKAILKFLEKEIPHPEYL